MENKTFPYPCQILFRVSEVNALNTELCTHYQFLIFSYKPCIVVLCVPKPKLLPHLLQQSPVRYFEIKKSK